jgi:omega-amidase
MKDGVRSLVVGLLQMDIRWLEPDKNLDEIELQIQEYGSTIDLLILPEMFTTGYILQPHSVLPIIKSLDKIFDRLIAISLKYNVALMGSTPYLENDKIYNRCLLVNGNDISSYDKIHLYRPVGEDKEYASGETIVNFDLHGIKIRPLICYDLRFPYLSMMGEMYDVLIYMANWPIPRIHHWDALLKARSIENQCYTIGVNRLGGDANKISYNGNSAVYRYDGECLANLQEQRSLQSFQLTFEEQDGYRSKLPFGEDRRGIVFER